MFLNSASSPTPYTTSIHKTRTTTGRRAGMGMSHRRSPRPRRQTAPRGRGRRAEGVRDARRQPPRGHQRNAAPLGKIAIVRVAATGSAAVVDALFGAGGLGSGAPSVLSIERLLPTRCRRARCLL